MIPGMKNTKYRTPAEGAIPFFYGPFEQIFFSGHTDLFYVRYSNAASAHAALRQECAALDPNPSLFEASSLAAYTQAGLFAERIAAGLLSVLGMLSLVLAAIGLMAGLAASFAIVQIIASTVSLHGNEPLVYGVAVLCVLAASVTAAWVPAMRATRVDPLTALRSE